MNQICQICGKICKNKLYNHVVRIHNIQIKDYYDKYIKLDTEGICPICNKETKFIRNHYNICCSQSCSAKYRNNINNHNFLVSQFEKEHNCTNIVKLRELYGQGWYKANIIDNYIETIIGSKMLFVNNSDIDKIIHYYNNCKLNKGKSKSEKHICTYLSNNNNIEFIENDKHQIYPYELDIFIPKLNLAIEYNGTWFHSIEAGINKDYHLNKSLLCRNNNIRLIHIYEFEDFNIQIKLLLDLVLYNIDNYPKEDFNKNNLIKNIPTSELIYTSNRNYHLYGAGKLY